MILRIHMARLTRNTRDFTSSTSFFSIHTLAELDEKEVADPGRVPSKPVIGDGALLVTTLRLPPPPLLPPRES